jgi:hypothetical protein
MLLPLLGLTQHRVHTCKRGGPVRVNLISVWSIKSSNVLTYHAANLTPTPNSVDLPFQINTPLSQAEKKCRPPTMPRPFAVSLHILLVFYASLCIAVKAAEEVAIVNNGPRRKGYTKGELVPVSCLNRTM